MSPCAEEDPPASVWAEREMRAKGDAAVGNSAAFRVSVRTVSVGFSVVVRAHRKTIVVVAILLASGACGAAYLRSKSNDAAAVSNAADDAAVHTTASSLDIDGGGGFVSAAAELAPVQAVLDAGTMGIGTRSLAPIGIAGQKIDIPAGTFASGSTPGDEGREPSIEPALVDVTLGAFSIDALPYPNDPQVVPEVVGSPAEATKLCASRNARLCTELEWEHACKGPSGDMFATGAMWNSECDRYPSRCASGFGVRGMGFMREWTDSAFEKTRDPREGAVVRGGTAKEASARRCASRSHATTKGMPSAMAFRCCYGDRNDVAVAPIEGRAPFKKTSLEASELAKIFAAVPELARISEDVRLFSDGDVKWTLSRSGASSDGVTFATTPIVWSPEPGVEVLVATGRAKKTGFIVALWPLPAGKYRFASSFLLLNDAAPVALAYESSHRKELRWTTCWGCAGEQGTVSLRDDGRIVIVQ